MTAKRPIPVGGAGLGMGEDDAGKETAPAHLGDSRESGERGAGGGAGRSHPRCGRARHEILAREDVEDREGGSGSQRVPEKRRGMERGRRLAAPGAHRRLAADRGRDRQSAAERLADEQEIRHDAVLFDGEPAAGAAEPGEDLIGDEERAVRRQRAERAGRRPRGAGRIPPRPWIGSRITAPIRR